MKYLLILTVLFTSLSALAGKLSVDITGMSCGMCVKAITGELEKTGKVEKINVSLDEKKASFSEKKGETISDSEVKQAIKKAGYTATTITRKK